MSCAEKIREARFFLELLDALEERKRPLTHDSTPSIEVSYLLGAFLNSLYSALEQAKSFVGVDAVQAYKAAHSAVLGGNGIRNTTIHERHVGIDHAGYIPPPGNAGNFIMRKTPRIVLEERASSKKMSMRFGPSHYIEYDGALTNVIDLCFHQHFELRDFLKSHGIPIE